MASGQPLFRKKFAFRRLLQKLSDGLGADNLKALKNLCYDVIPKGQLEAVDSGLVVFNALFEQDMISADNVTFLCELMDEIGRKDLTTEVKQYVEEAEAPTPAGSKYLQELNSVTLQGIANDIGKEWRMVSRYLGLDETTIDSIQSKHHGDLREQALQALLWWQKNSGTEATRGALKRALVEVKLMAVVHKYFDAVV